MTSFQLNDGSEYEPDAELLENLHKAFPAADLEREVAAMKVWALGNATKRCTRKGAIKFMNTWLAKTQNAASSNANNVRAGNFGGKPDPVQQRSSPHGDEYRHLAAGREIMRALLNKQPVPELGTFKLNIRRLAEVIIQREGADLQAGYWSSEKQFQSACYGTIEVLVRRWWQT